MKKAIPQSDDKAVFPADTDFSAVDASSSTSTATGSRSRSRGEVKINAPRGKTEASRAERTPSPSAAAQGEDRAAPAGAADSLPSAAAAAAPRAKRNQSSSSSTARYVYIKSRILNKRLRIRIQPFKLSASQTRFVTRRAGAAAASFAAEHPAPVPFSPALEWSALRYFSATSFNFLTEDDADPREVLVWSLYAEVFIAEVKRHRAANPAPLPAPRNFKFLFGPGGSIKLASSRTRQRRAVLTREEKIEVMALALDAADGHVLVFPDETDAPSTSGFIENSFAQCSFRFPSAHRLTGVLTALGCQALDIFERYFAREVKRLRARIKKR